MTEKKSKKTIMKYLVVKCPRCGTLYLDSVPANYALNDLQIENYEVTCPICERVIYIGEKDTGDEFQ
jgi:endogenous inhibitor of DNA gyrase (YacG/DUF329 family)